MAVELSIFTTASSPQTRGDMWKEAFHCYQALADEVVVLCGDRHVPRRTYDDTIRYKIKLWPEEFNWDFIGQQFQRGYEACEGDWVIHCDLDFIFHEQDFKAIRQALYDNHNAPAISFYKWQFILPDRYNLKSRLVLAVNKKVYGDRIKFNAGGDLCQPSLDGEELDLNKLPQSGIPFYNYEKMIKTTGQIMNDVGRMDRAFKAYYGHFLYSEDGTDESAYYGWLKMMQGRFNKPSRFIELSEHPKFVQETIMNLQENQWGYSGFGLGRNRYVA